jgi:hypothetical protein
VFPDEPAVRTDRRKKLRERGVIIVGEGRKLDSFDCGAGGTLCIRTTLVQTAVTAGAATLSTRPLSMQECHGISNGFNWLMASQILQDFDSF